MNFYNVWKVMKSANIVGEILPVISFFLYIYKLLGWETKLYLVAIFHYIL